MNDFLNPEELAAAQKSVVEQKEKPVETPVITEPPPAPIITEPPVPSSLTDAEKEKEIADAAAIEAAKANPSPVAETFDQQLEKYLAEKTAGKYKKFEEVQAILDKPVEEYDDDIKRLQELKRSGTALDKDYWELQSLNLEPDEDGIIDTEFIVMEAMKRKPETAGLSPRALVNLLNKKYDFNEWVKKPEEEFTEDDFTNRELMLRDAQNDLEFLTKLKEEKAFIKPVDPEEAKRQADLRKSTIQSFEKMVDDELFAKVIAFSTEIEIDKDTKEVYEYKVSEADRKRAADILKLSVADLSVLVTQFAEKDATGKLKVNDRKVYDMILNNIISEDRVKNAFKDGMAIGAKNYVKTELKNATFTPADSRTENPVATTEAEAIALALKASGKKF